MCSRKREPAVGRDRRVAGCARGDKLRRPAIVNDGGVGCCARVVKAREPAVVVGNGGVTGRARADEERALAAGVVTVGNDGVAGRARIKEIHMSLPSGDEDSIAGRGRVQELQAPAGSRESRCVRGIINNAGAGKNDSAINIKGISRSPGVELNSADQYGGVY